MQIVSIDVHGLGGVCRWYGVPSPRWRAIIAWGGVLAQAVVTSPTHNAAARPMNRAGRGRAPP